MDTGKKPGMKIKIQFGKPKDEGIPKAPEMNEEENEEEEIPEEEKNTALQLLMKVKQMLDAGDIEGVKNIVNEGIAKLQGTENEEGEEPQQNRLRTELMNKLG